MARNATKPLGCLKRNGAGLARAAGAVHWYLEYEGPQAVFVDAQGRVFAFPDGTIHALAWLEHRSHCLVGRYTQTHGRRNATFPEMRKQIVDDLRERMRELYQAKVA